MTFFKEILEILHTYFNNQEFNLVSVNQLQGKAFFVKQKKNDS